MQEVGRQKKALLSRVLVYDFSSKSIINARQWNGGYF